MTLLGDYWLGRTEQLPSAALVELLAEFDITEPSARAALNRLTKRGLLATSKQGRHTFYGPSPRAVPLLRETFRRIVAFGAQETRAWDGAWTIVAFSVPEPQRQLRHAVRTNLRWLGYAAFYDGVWCSPWAERDTALATLSEFEVESATVVRAKIDPRSAVQPLSAWDLEAVERRYLEFDERFTPVLDDARRQALTASEALVARTEVMDSWRSFLAAEPDLPAQLLPVDWPRSRMRELFFELYNELAPVAKGRCQQIVARHAPELGALVTHHTAADPAAGA